MTPSKEDYLKAMLELPDDGGIRSIDVANALGISKASVSCMMNVLKDDGYVPREVWHGCLTEAGQTRLPV